MFLWELWGKWPGCCCCSLTLSAVASFSLTNRRLPAKLFPNRWICFLQQGAFLFFVLNKAKYYCCLSLQHSAVYFTPPAMDISQEDKLPYQLLYSLLAAPQITSAYVYTPYFKSQTTPRDCLPSFAPAMLFPLLRKTVLFFHKLSTAWQFWAKCRKMQVFCNWSKLKLREIISNQYSDISMKRCLQRIS